MEDWRRWCSGEVGTSDALDRIGVHPAYTRLYGSALFPVEDAIPVADSSNYIITNYTRHHYPLHANFFTRFWWFGFILMLLGLFCIMFLIGVFIYVHFDIGLQNQRRNELSEERAARKAEEDDDEEDEDEVEEYELPSHTTPVCFHSPIVSALPGPVDGQRVGGGGVGVSGDVICSKSALADHQQQRGQRYNKPQSMVVRLLSRSASDDDDAPLRVEHTLGAPGQEMRAMHRDDALVPGELSVESLPSCQEQQTPPPS